MEREDIFNKHPIRDFVEERGASLKQQGSELTTNCCPITTHGDGHNCVNVNEEKQTWYCNDCCEGGSVIDWIMKEASCTTGEAMEFLGGGQIVSDGPDTIVPKAVGSVGPSTSVHGTHPKETAVYDYTDENGSLLYQVIRYEPKTFKQRQPKDDDWQWDLKGITRVLYNLPQVLLAETVLLTEGEKDANNLNALGLTAVATTNAGGSGAWLPAYADTLRGKDVIVFEDNDEAGRKRTPIVLESLKDLAASVKVIKISGHKDISDWLLTIPEALRAIKLNELIDKTPHAIDPIPVYSVKEAEEMFSTFVQDIDKSAFSLSAFSKTLGGIVGSLWPGEVVMLMGDTSQGKTAFMQAIAKAAAPLPTLFFELELPMEVMFMRQLQMERGCYQGDVIRGYKESPTGRYADSFKGMQHIWTCPKSGIGMDRVKEYIIKSELKIGERPKVVFIDYMGLVRASKNSFVRGRYETMAYNAQEAKNLAKETNTIVFMGSQVGRPSGSKQHVQEVEIHHGKGAGELEESANLVLGVSRPDDDTLQLKVNKWTRGKVGTKILFDFDGPKLKITERLEQPTQYAT